MRHSLLRAINAIEDDALTVACNWAKRHPRIECAVLCALIYGAFWFAGTP